MWTSQIIPARRLPHAARVDVDHGGTAAELSATTSVISSGVLTAAELMLTFSAPAWMSRVASSRVRMPPPTVNGMKICLGDAPHHVEHDLAAFVAGADVEEDQLVGALLLVAARHLDRIAGVAQVEEVDALDDPAAVDVQTGDDAFGQQWLILKRVFVTSL